MNLDPSDGIAIFSDGSSNSKDRSGGWGWVALDAQANIRTDSGFRAATTNNQMELYAPTQALTWLHEHCGSCDVIVYSDSLYVVLGSKNRSRARKVNHQFWENLDKAVALHQHIEWQHIKGHSGSQYNDLADKLAGEARLEGLKQ